MTNRFETWFALIIHNVLAMGAKSCTEAKLERNKVLSSTERTRYMMSSCREAIKERATEVFDRPAPRAPVRTDNNVRIPISFLSTEFPMEECEAVLFLFDLQHQNVFSRFSLLPVTCDRKLRNSSRATSLFKFLSTLRKMENSVTQAV